MGEKNKQKNKNFWGEDFSRRVETAARTEQLFKG